LKLAGLGELWRACKLGRRDTGPIDTHPLRLVERPVPLPHAGQVRVHVRACGVCRTDLHLAEGDLPPKHPHVTRDTRWSVSSIKSASGAPGSRKETELGSLVSSILWSLSILCGRAGELCTDPRFTGWDLDGGYASYVVVDESFAYEILNRSTMRRPRHCCVRGSSASAPCAGPVATRRRPRIYGSVVQPTSRTDPHG